MALTETIAFSQAVDVADLVTNPKNTLIVVTSDHSHTMTINGYPSREDRIVGQMDHNSEAYSILSYANGPSADSHAAHTKQSSKYGKFTPDAAHSLPKTTVKFTFSATRFDSFFSEKTV